MAERPYTREQQASVQRVCNLDVTAYYDILGVRADSSDGDIRKAYKTLALQLHPDKNGAPDAHAAFQRIGAAFDVLSDPQKRTQHDDQLAQRAAQLAQHARAAEEARRREYRRWEDEELARLARFAAAAEHSQRMANASHRAEAHQTPRDHANQQRRAGPSRTSVDELAENMRRGFSSMFTQQRRQGPPLHRQQSWQEEWTREESRARQEADDLEYARRLQKEEDRAARQRAADQTAEKIRKQEEEARARKQERSDKAQARRDDARRKLEEFAQRARADAVAAGEAAKQARAAALEQDAQRREWQRQHDERFRMSREAADAELSRLAALAAAADNNRPGKPFN